MTFLVFLFGCAAVGLLVYSADLNRELDREARAAAEAAEDRAADAWLALMRGPVVA